jgi:hypothetical protein
MNTLLGLPKYQFLDFVVDWIPLEDLAKLDTCVCSRSFRGLFLAHLPAAIFYGYSDKNCSQKSWDLSFLFSYYMEDKAASSVIKWLKIRNVTVNHIFLTNANIEQALSTKLGSLTSLCLSLSSSFQVPKLIPDESISFLISKTPKLTSIYVSEAGTLISETALLNVLKYFNNQITTLILGFNSIMSLKMIVRSITENLTCLTTLNFSTSFIDDSDVELICSHCVPLIRLDISYNHKLTPKRSGVAIVNNLVNLSYIAFDQKATPSCLWFRILRRRFAKFLSLDLIRCIAEGVSLPTRLSLTKVEVVKEMSFSRHLGFGSDVFNLNDNVHFFPTCNELEHMVMPRYVVGLVLDTFAYHCCSKHLVELNLQGNQADTILPLDPNNDLLDGSLFILASTCSMLETINFSFRECITDIGMMALLAKNPMLTKLYCVNCSNLGSDTMLAVSQHCSRLKILNMSSCGDLTDVHLTQLALGCTHLVHVAINNLDHVSTVAVTLTSVKMLVECCTGLENVQRSAPGESYSRKRKYHVRLFDQQDFVPELEP